MKKLLLLSTLILTSSLMLAPYPGKVAQGKVAQAPVAQVQQASTIAEAIRQLQANIQKGTGPIVKRLEALERNITDLTAAAGQSPAELPEDAKNLINSLMDKLETEANELWEKFGGSSLKWMYPSTQTKELKSIVKNMTNIKNLHNKVNPTNILLRPVYDAASTATSFVKKNPWSTALCSFLVYRIGKECYKNGLFPSFETLANAVSCLKWTIIG
jgi:hypothetical protein